MNTQDMTLPLPSDLIATLRRLASDRDEPFERLVRSMLDREVMRLRSAQASQRMRAERLARFHLLLAPVIEAARGWGDLQSRLALFGFELRPEGHAIALFDRATGEWLCRGADLGIAYPLLTRRFAGPLPDPTANIDATPGAYVCRASVSDGLHPVA
jgi:hypothetical protein